MSLCILLLLVCPFTAIGQFQDADWLEQGLLAEFRGEYEQALNIWEDARDELEEPDSRIGLEYIRVASEQGLEDYFEEASQMYYWAISSPFEGVNRAAIRQEIERLRPIIGDGVYRQWLNWFENRNPRLASDMRGFWVQMDPTPGTSINERLIEHWQRIAYSRANFVKNRNTIYGTDDRTIIYVKYGEPDFKRSGVFTVDNQNLGRWLARQFVSAELPGDPEDERTVFQFDREDAEVQESFEQLDEYVFQFHQYPEYEIWLYEPISDHLEEPLIFIFGTDVHTGDYHLQKSIDDFIPQRAYLSDRRAVNMRSEFVREGLTPALALQLLYYEQLRDVDTYFEERLNTIRNSFIEQGPLAYTSLDLSLRSQNREILEMRVSEAPGEASSIGRLLPGIPVDIHQYRLLDEDLNPVILSFVESNPKNALMQDLQINLAREREDIPEPDSPDQLQDDLTDYQLQHKLIVFNEEWREHERHEHTPALTSVAVSDDQLIQSLFTSRHEVQYYQSAASKLYNLDLESRTQYSTIFPNELRGLGSVNNQQPRPLSADPGRLEMGDLILGFYQDGLPEDYPFSFKVVNEQAIPADESLLLHFEVYNLEPDPETGFTRFELTYRIFPVLEDGTVMTDQEAFYLTINFQDDVTRVVEDLEIQTPQLAGGLYELQVYIEDMVSGQESYRDIRFEVSD